MLASVSWPHWIVVWSGCFDHKRSKHLKGRLGPGVSDGHVFGSNGGRLGPRVGDGHVFGSMEVSWDPASVT